MLGCTAKKSARLVLNLELLEDRRLLSASLLGALNPVLADVRPALVAVEHVVAQTSAAAVSAVSSAVPPAALPAVALKVEVAAKVASPLPAIVPDVSLDTQVDLGPSSTSIPAVQAQLGVTTDTNVTPTQAPPVTVGVSVGVTTGTSTPPISSPVTISVQGGVTAANPATPALPVVGPVNVGVAVTSPAPTTPVSATALATPVATPPVAPVGAVTTPTASSNSGGDNQAAAAVTPSAATQTQVAAATPTAAFSPSPQMLDALFRDAATLNAITANVAAAAALSNSLIPQVLAAAATVRTLPTSGSTEGVAVVSPDRGLPTPALRVENLPAFLDLVRAENLSEAEGSPQLLDLLAEVNPAAVAGLEQAALQLLGQFRALQQQVGEMLAGMGLYHWLLGLALGAAALSLHVRQQRRKAAAREEANALLLGAPEFAFLGQGPA